MRRLLSIAAQRAPNSMPLLAKPLTRKAAGALLGGVIALPMVSSMRQLQREEEDAEDWSVHVREDEKEEAALPRRAEAVMQQRSQQPAVVRQQGDAIVVHTASLEEELNRAMREAFGSGGGGAGGGGGAAEPWPSYPVAPTPRQHTPTPVILPILAVNVAVYGAWQVPSLQGFMSRWFLTSSVHLGQGFRGVVTALAATYSHSSAWHLAANMITLWSFGPHLLRQGPHDPRDTPRTPRLSGGEFLAFYTAAGLASSIGSNLFMASMGSGRPALGASGSIFGVFSYFAFSHPDAGTRLLFFIDASASQALAMATAVNAYLSYREYRAFKMRVPGPMFDGFAHLVGTAVGYAWYKWAAASRRRSSSSSSSGSGSGGKGRGGGGSGSGSGGGSGGGGSDTSYRPPRIAANPGGAVYG